MLADKDLAGVIAATAARIDRWFVATVPGPRGATADVLREALTNAGIAPAAIRMFDDVETAFAAAREAVAEADRIIVFGSFLTVAAAMEAA
jgi:dihydrofolate synthase/folylpolyglutamate synthase